MIEETLRKKLLRKQEQIDILETIIEDASREVFTVNEKLVASASFLEDVYRTMPEALFVLDGSRVIKSANVAAATLLEYRSVQDLIGNPVSAIVSPFSSITLDETIASVVQSETNLTSRTGKPIAVLLSVSALRHGEQEGGWVCVALDLRERQRLELELRHAQKLESVGRLAAGVAHEINTPTQFVCDSVHVVREALEDIFRLLEAHRALRDWATTHESARALVAAVSDLERDVDLPYLAESLPKSVNRALDGLRRIATIVRSMTAFAHPEQRKMTQIDINDAITNTLTIARNEYKYVADVDTDLGDIPLVTCHAGDLNQAMLNVIVNAAHAVGDAVKGTAAKGAISIRTRHEDGHVLIVIKDTGRGIPEAIRDRIFDPFFTTKDVGRGTGQGLAITRSIIADRHGGSITFDTDPDRGTTFVIRLPVEARVNRAKEVAA